MKCIQCHEREIVIKKRQLCLLCAGRFYRGHLEKPFHERIKTLSQSRATLTKYEMFAEINFVKEFFTHKNWVHHPAIFHLNNVNYAPDFYDSERNVFIEVIGTRQAFHANKEKYALMTTIFPKINFEIRDNFGNLIPLEGRQEWKTERDEQKQKGEFLC